MLDEMQEAEASLGSIELGERGPVDHALLVSELEAHLGVQLLNVADASGDYDAMSQQLAIERREALPKAVNAAMTPKFTHGKPARSSAANRHLSHQHIGSAPKHCGIPSLL
jgi:hypothetical protein